VAGLLVSLRFLASLDVRNDAFYMPFYLLLGAGWLGGATFLFPLFGVNARDDVIERSNPAASWTVCGALIGVTLCYGGANIGNGPGPGVVLFCALLGTATFFLLWLALELVSAPSEAITVERDEGVGIRVAGLLAGFGILLGAAVAGDWVSAYGTIVDFCLRGWPVIPLLAVAAALERVFKNQVQPFGQPDGRSFGIGALYVLASAMCVAARGWR
jgi:uncharacterized membrane protein YjfL (UPF0719 family)